MDMRTDQIGLPGNASPDSALELLVWDIGRQLAAKHDPQEVERVMGSLLEQYRGARITVYLPTLLMKKASRLLKLPRQ